MRPTVLRIALSGRGAPLLVAAFAASVCDTVGRAACNSCLRAALLLTAPATAMRKTALRAALSDLGAALVMAAPASAMRDTVLRAD
jgi:hypothetical protein